MNVNEIKSKINEGTSGKNNDELTVEFVIGDKKFFIQDMKAGTDTMEINVSRNSYKPTTVNHFAKTLEHATSDLNVTITNQDNNETYKVDGLFFSDVFVEITVQQ